MKIATWNVNSIRARETLVLDWLRRVVPDVLCMQETKIDDDDFPTEEFQRLGYGIAMAGEKSYNGVAIASRLPFSDVSIGFPGGSADASRRLIAVTVEGIRVISVYVPNGRLVGSTHFVEKLAWLGMLRDLVREERTRSEVVVAGDYNVAPEDRDVFDPASMRGQLHFHPDEHRALAGLCATGLTDAFRLHHQERAFSWWDYRSGAVRKNEGLRIDYLLVTPGLAERCVAAWIDADERLKEKPSDHAPVVAELR